MYYVSVTRHLQGYMYNLVNVLRTSLTTPTVLTPEYILVIVSVCPRTRVPFDAVSLATLLLL